MTRRQKSSLGQILFPITEIFVVKREKFRSHQVLVWIPLVTLVIGTSCSGTPVQTSFHRPRLTSPCSLLTPLECRLKRKARIVMLNGSVGVDPGLAEREKFVERQTNFGGETRRNICASFRAGTNRCPPAPACGW